MTIKRITELPELPTRPDDGHKGTFGRVLIIAGSRGMSGAASLAGLGALRGGAGLVYVAVPEEILPTVAAVEPSFLTIPLPDDALPALQDVIPNQSAIAVGPGLGQSAAIKKLVRTLYESVEVPLVVDADGLNAIAGEKEKLTPTGPRILTPHPGEFARLIGSDINTVENNREELAVQFASQRDVVLVLKGHRTIITDGHQIAVNATGNSGMATGGSGDVLTGLITGLLAQRMSPFAAAQLGVHLHGLAGDLAAAELSQPGLIASDLPRFLPAAWKALGVE